MFSGADDLTTLMAAARAGDAAAESRLMEVVYPELRRLASSYLRRERPEHTLQPTALVNEAWLRLSGQSLPMQDRTHFFGIAAHLMRQVLVEHARNRAARKRNGGERLPLDENVSISLEESTEVLALHEALEKLGAIDARQSQIVELRYFGGLTILEVAQVLGISDKTVRRDWEMARVWLHREISVKA